MNVGTLFISALGKSVSPNYDRRVSEKGHDFHLIVIFQEIMYRSKLICEEKIKANGRS